MTWLQDIKVATVPELVVLRLPDEEAASLLNVSPEQLLRRWVNLHLAKVHNFPQFPRRFPCRRFTDACTWHSSTTYSQVFVRSFSCVCNLLKRRLQQRTSLGEVLWHGDLCNVTWMLLHSKHC